MVEEVKDPYRNLPRAIGISIPIVTAIYVMANVAYLVVLTPQEIVTSTAVVVVSFIRFNSVNKKSINNKVLSRLTDIWGPCFWLIHLDYASASSNVCNGGASL